MEDEKDNEEHRREDRQNIMLALDAEVGFMDAITNFRIGAVCADKLGPMNVLLAEGLNLGLHKMMEASSNHGYWQCQLSSHAS